MPKIQLVIIVVVAVYFFVLDTGFYAGLAAVYGGLISLVNTILINRHTHKQSQKHNIELQASVGMMAISVIMRMAFVVVLVLTGLGLLGLNASALIVGLVFGLMGFLVDKVLQK